MPLAGFLSQGTRYVGAHAARNSDADDGYDCEYGTRPYGCGAREIEQSALDTHHSSVNSDGAICNITLVSIVVQSLSRTSDGETAPVRFRLVLSSKVTSSRPLKLEPEAAGCKMRPLPDPRV